MEPAEERNFGVTVAYQPAGERICRHAKEEDMKIRTFVLGGIVGVGALTAMAAPAAADIACNRWGDCWHVDSRYDRPSIRFEYHPDDWYFHREWRDRDRWRWRGYREGHGYWRNGVWITF
jgi:hypothetical protein